MHDLDFSNAVKFTRDTTDQVFDAEMDNYNLLIKHPEEMMGASCVIGMGCFVYGTLSQAVIEEMVRSDIARNTPWLPQRALEFTDHLMDEAFDTPAEKLEPIQMAVKTFPICGQILELGADMVRSGAVDPEQVSDAIFELASIHAPE